MLLVQKYDLCCKKKRSFMFCDLRVARLQRDGYPELLRQLCCFFRGQGWEKFGHEANPSPSSSSQHLQTLHLQHRIHGAASSRKGEATNNKTPKPAKIPTTCNRITSTSCLIPVPNTCAFYAFLNSRPQLRYYFA